MARYNNNSVLAVLLLSAALVAGVQACPDEFEAVGSSCFYGVTPSSSMFGPVLYEWTVARELCQNRSTEAWSVDLASNFDFDKLRLVKPYMEKLNITAPCALGYYMKDGQRQWFDGSVITDDSYMWYMPMPADDYTDSEGGALLAYDRVYLYQFGNFYSYLCEALRKAA